MWWREDLQVQSQLYDYNCKSKKTKKEQGEKTNVFKKQQIQKLEGCEAENPIFIQTYPKKPVKV